MGRKAKRLKLKARIERLSAQASRPSPVIENSVMQERVKEEVPPVPDTNFTPEVVEEMVKEVEEMVEEVKAKPKPRRRRSPTKRKAGSKPKT